MMADGIKKAIIRSTAKEEASESLILSLIKYIPPMITVDNAIIENIKNIK